MVSGCSSCCIAGRPSLPVPAIREHRAFFTVWESCPPKFSCQHREWATKLQYQNEGAIPTIGTVTLPTPSMWLLGISRLVHRHPVCWSWNSQPPHSRSQEWLTSVWNNGSCAECWPQLFKTSARSRHMHAGCQYYPSFRVEAPEIPACIQVLMARAIHPRAGRAYSSPFGIGFRKMSIWYRPQDATFGSGNLPPSSHQSTTCCHRCSLTTPSQRTTYTWVRCSHFVHTSAQRGQDHIASHQAWWASLPGHVDNVNRHVLELSLTKLERCWCIMFSRSHSNT